MRLEILVGNLTFGVWEFPSLTEAKQRLDLGSCEELGDELCSKRDLHETGHGHIRPRYYAGKANVTRDGLQYRPAVLPQIGEVLCRVIRGDIINTVVTLKSIPEGGRAVP